MCGRFAITSPPEAVRAFFGYAENPNFPPRFNIAPTQPIPIVSARRERRRRSGISSWRAGAFCRASSRTCRNFRCSSTPAPRRLAEKPSFRAALRRRRCLVPADCWYEWRANLRGPKTPYLLRRRVTGA